MFIQPARMTSALLVFGIFFTFFISCSSLQKTTLSAEDYYEQNKYQQALERVNAELTEYPDDNSRKLLKARILRNLAVNGQRPAERQSIYRSMRNTIEEVQFSSAADAYDASADSILSTAWAHEQGEGVRFLQQDGSENFNRYYDLIIAHFDNAITIIPDSLVTYNLKATTHYRHGELDKAVATLESIGENGFEKPVDSREKLAYLYLESGDIDTSVELYASLVSDFPNNSTYRQGLANAYILGDRHEEATTILETLANEFPNRPEYSEALSTERFYQLHQEASRLISESSLTPGDAVQIADSLRSIAEAFHSVEQSLPNSTERNERITNFHLDAASLLQRIGNSLDASSEASETLSAERDNHLKDTIPILQNLYESNAENVDYARKLIRVYQSLDMTSEAESMERQINF
ncbi:MAG: tetratricopeptide repeat protein [Bacteroidetes bacterium]|jgi:hypothetical protein|nr:tetratricopeptide repeat protein [Bacteroidota bacterium]